MPSLAEIFNRKKIELDQSKAAKEKAAVTREVDEANARYLKRDQLWVPFRAKEQETRSLLEYSGLLQLIEEAKAIVDPVAATVNIGAFFNKDIYSGVAKSDEVQAQLCNKHYAGLKISIQWKDRKYTGGRYEYSYITIFFHRNGEVKIRNTSIKRGQWEQNSEVFKELLVEDLLSPHYEYSESPGL